MPRAGPKAVARRPPRRRPRSAGSTRRTRGCAGGWAEGGRGAAAGARAERRGRDGGDARLRRATGARAAAAISAAVEDGPRRTTPVLDDLADLVVDAALDLAEAIIGRELSA